MPYCELQFILSEILVFYQSVTKHQLSVSKHQYPCLCFVPVWFLDADCYTCSLPLAYNLGLSNSVTCGSKNTKIEVFCSPKPMGDATMTMSSFYIQSGFHDICWIAMCCTLLTLQELDEGKYFQVLNIAP